MTRLFIVPVLLAVAAPAVAQETAPPASGGLGGLGGLLGGALPGVSKVGAGNAAGVIGYCIKNNYLSQANAGSVLSRLTGRQAVTTSPGYTAGQSGVLQAGDQALPLADLKGQVRTKLCNLVLKRGASFLGR
jgi:hypothetical protein